MQGMGGPVQVSMPLCSTVSENEEVDSKPLVGFISPPAFPVESQKPEHVPMPIHMPLVNGTRPNDSYTVPDTRLDYGTDIIGDDLDELLDRASPPESSLVSLRAATFLLLFWVHTRHVNVCLFSPTQDIPTVDGPIPLPTSIAVSSSIQSSLLMPSHMGHPFLSMAPHCTINLPAPYHKPISSYSLGLDTFSSPLDSLDSLSISESSTGALLIMAS